MTQIEDNDTTNRKNIYKLWWEYLRRSDGYKTYCEKYPDAVNDSPLFGVYYWGDPDDDEFQKEYMKWCRASCFGNVHNDPFDVWWNKFTQLPAEESTIEELSTHIDEMMEIAYSSTRGRKSIKSTNKSLRVFIERPDLPYVYLRINADTFTTDDIKEIKRIIRGKKENFIERRNGGRLGMRYNKRQYFKEVGRIRYDELQRYLKIYDLKITGMKWPDIFKKTYPNKKWNEDNRRSILSEYGKAKKIVKNVEKGDFPGKYY